jgi:basic membrane protein A
MTTNNPDLPQNVVAEMKAAEMAIVDGKLNPFKGPIKDQNGVQKVAANAVIPDAELKGMNWLVDGVQGKLPSAG